MEPEIFSMHNRLAMEAAQKCGCYCCMRIYKIGEIEQWTDRGSTAICPYCGIDAVLPDIEGVINVDYSLLSMLHEKYFA